MGNSAAAMHAFESMAMGQWGDDNSCMEYGGFFLHQPKILNESILYFSLEERSNGSVITILINGSAHSEYTVQNVM